MNSGMFDPNARNFPLFQHSSSGSSTSSIKFKEQLNMDGDGDAGKLLKSDILPQDLERQKAIIVDRSTNKEKIAETKTTDGEIEQPAWLKKVIGLWLGIEAYRRKLWKDIVNAPGHYAAQLKEVLDPLSTAKDVPDQVKILAQMVLVYLKLTSSSKRIEPENISLDQLLGMDTAISEMRKILERLQGSAEYARLNVKVPSGILIHGPYGTGKSSLVHAFAREAKLPFFVVKGDEIEKDPSIIKSLFSGARVRSPSIVYIERIEVITSTGVSQILDQMKSFEKDGAVVVVIGTADNVETMVKDIKSDFGMRVHLGEPDIKSRTKMVDRLMEDYVLMEDKDKICQYIASETTGMVWYNIKGICNECCAHVIEGRENAVGVTSWVTIEDVSKTLKRTKYGISLLEKDAKKKDAKDGISLLEEKDAKEKDAKEDVAEAANLKT